MENEIEIETIFDAVDNRIEYWESSKQCKPTEALPGSDEKFEELKRRVEAGEPLWHDADRLVYDDSSEN